MAYLAPRKCKFVFFLVGPTGSGKTELSLLLAERLGCEIISADSMLVYRGMDIGTAKPSPAERRKIPHHLIDLVSPRLRFSVYQYRKLALEAIQNISKRGRIPLVVGGSGLYVNVLRKGLSGQPGGNANLRKRLEKEARGRGAVYLYERLKKIDPDRASEIHPNDQRRIIRALEIASLSGALPSAFYRKPPSPVSLSPGGGEGRVRGRVSLENLGFSVKAFGITRDRSDLYERIDRRVEKMFRQGFIREVKRLKRIGFSKTARQALGYREILASLRGGVAEEAISEPRLLRPYGARNDGLVQLVQKRTRQFAKRQLTWFRREKEIQWVPWERKKSVSWVCDKMIQQLNSWREKKSS